MESCFALWKIYLFDPFENTTWQVERSSWWLWPVCMWWNGGKDQLHECSVKKNNEKVAGQEAAVSHNTHKHARTYIEHLVSVLTQVSGQDQTKTHKSFVINGIKPLVLNGYCCEPLFKSKSPWQQQLCFDWKTAQAEREREKCSYTVCIYNWNTEWRRKVLF